MSLCGLEEKTMTEAQYSQFLIGKRDFFNKSNGQDATAEREDRKTKAAADPEAAAAKKQCLIEKRALAEQKKKASAEKRAERARKKAGLPAAVANGAHAPPAAAPHPAGVQQQQYNAGVAVAQNGMLPQVPGAHAPPAPVPTTAGIEQQQYGAVGGGGGGQHGALGDLNYLFAQFLEQQQQQQQYSVVQPHAVVRPQPVHPSYSGQHSYGQGQQREQVPHHNSFYDHLLSAPPAFPHPPGNSPLVSPPSNEFGVRFQSTSSSSSASGHSASGELGGAPSGGSGSGGSANCSLVSVGSAGSSGCPLDLAHPSVDRHPVHGGSEGPSPSGFNSAGYDALTAVANNLHQRANPVS
jgi:hypothetical protein